MFKRELKKLGLTEGEAKVYEALLKLGSTTVGPLVKEATVAYSNIYEILDRLIQKGLVSFIIREKTKYFQASEPTRINDYLEKQEAEIQENKELLQIMLPKLEGLKNVVDKKEHAEIFIGKKGLLTAYEELIKDAKRDDKAMFFYVYDPVKYGSSEYFYKKSWELLQKIPLKWKGISNEEYRKTKLAKESASFIEQRYISFPVPANIDIVNKKVLITVWEEKPVGILINSPEIYDNFMNYFEAMWSVAKK